MFSVEQGKIVNLYNRITLTKTNVYTYICVRTWIISDYNNIICSWYTYYPSANYTIICSRVCMFTGVYVNSFANSRTFYYVMSVSNPLIISYYTTMCEQFKKK